MNAGETILSWIISYYDPDQEDFDIHVHEIEITFQNILFWTTWPPLGVVHEIHLVFPRGRHVDDFVDCHYVLSV